MTVPPVLPLGFVAAVGGLALGLAYFAALWLAVRQHVTGGGRPAVALHLVRIALAGSGLWLLVQFGPPALIGGMLGMVAARQVAVHIIRSGRC